MHSRAAKPGRRGSSIDQPLLDLVELLQLAERDVDHDRGAATGHVNLLRAVDVEVLELSLELVVGSLEVEESLKR